MPRQRKIKVHKVRLPGISKRGDTSLRTLFIHGARAATLLAKEPDPWVTERMKRRPTRVAVVGMANKIARTVWAQVAHERSYDKNTSASGRSERKTRVKHSLFQQKGECRKVARADVVMTTTGKTVTH